MLLTASYATIAASTEDDIEHINQADQAITAITLPPVQQALLNTEKIGYQFGHKPIGDGVPFASPYPYRYDSGFSNDCVAFDGNVTDSEDGTGDYYWASTPRYNAEPLDLPYDVPRSGLWVAAGGNRGFRPLVSATNNEYANAPKGLKSRLVCGPYDLSKSTTIQLKFKYLNLGRYTSVSNDEFFVGISNDGQTFLSTELQYAPNWATRQWTSIQNEYVGHDNIYFMFEFSTKTALSKGAWISNINVRGNFDPPECGNLSAGYKGINLPAGDPNFGGANFVPFVREGADQATTKVGPDGIDADFVRLEFIAKHGNQSDALNGVMLDEYDYIVDHLCSKGVGVVGILTHKTILDKYTDYAGNGPDADSRVARDAFVAEAARLAEHYAGRITYWEIWNEPDFDPDLSNPVADAPRLSTDNFADILGRGSQEIKSKNPNAKIILGGLSSPWPDVNNYYASVLNTLKNEYAAPSFDYFANHPYSSGSIGHANCDPGFPCYGISPQEYMLQSPAHGNAPNFLHKFQNTFAEVYEGEPEPPVWITEIGWNASLESDKNRNCEEQLLVSGVGQNNEQAEYLWNSFDILSEIPQLNSSQPAIEKVFWYQYLDIMVETPGRCRGNRVNDTTPNSAAVIRWRHDTAWHQSDGQPSRSVCSPQDADMAWFFGLFEPDCDNLIAPGYQPSQRPKPYQACAFKLFDRQQETIFADLNWQACNLFTASESSSRDEARVTSDYMLELNWLIYGASLVEQYNIYHATVPDLAAATFVGTVPTYFPTMAFPDGKPYQWLDEHSEHGITHYYWIYEQSLGTQGGNPIKEFEIHLPLPPMPSVSIRHNGETLARNAEITVRANQDFTLEWQSTNATACWASGGWRGAKNLTDSETLPGFTKKSKTFRLECFNAARQKFTTRVIVRTTDDEFEANNPFDPNPCICPPNNDQ